MGMSRTDDAFVSNGLDMSESMVVTGFTKDSCTPWSCLKQPEQPPYFPVVSPPSPSRASQQGLISWFHTYRPLVKEQLLHHGALLFRGFDLMSAADMEAVLVSFFGKDSNDGLHRDYQGTSPRTLQPQCDYFFSAADIPTYFPIPQHLEVSHMPQVPRMVFFGCVQAPTNQGHGRGGGGGETSLADFRKVYQALPVSLRDKLQTKGIRYTRIHPYQQHCRWWWQQWLKRYDIHQNTSWPSLFGTDSREKVDQLCWQDKGIYHHSWLGNALVVTTFSDAFQRHAETNEPVYFNHLQVFHWTSFFMELWRTWWRTQQHELLWHLVGTCLFCFVKYGVLQHSWALHVTYGDGHEFSWTDLSAIRQAIHQHMLYPQWQPGDLLLLDNLSMSHGRQPTMDSNRHIVVAWSQLWTKTNQMRKHEEGPTQGPTNTIPKPTLQENDTDICSQTRPLSNCREL